MTTPESQPQTPDEQQNRILAVVALYGSRYFAPLVESVTYNPNDDQQRKSLRTAYDGLPKELNEDEAALLSIYVSVAATKVKPEIEPQKSEINALRWLGSVATDRDKVTQRSVSRLLWHEHGIRGKLAAASLWYDRLIYH